MIAGVGAVMIEWPLPCEIVTSLPGVGLPLASCKVTVMVVVLLPSAGTLFGEALMPPAAAGGATKLIVAVWGSVTLSVTSVAVKVMFSMVVSVRWNTTAPLFKSDGPLTDVITAWLVPFGVNVTLLPLTG